MDKLPGPLPISLNRSSVEIYLKIYIYWFCEKSNGERSMLLITDINSDGNNRAWLVNRSLSFRQLPWSSKLCYHFSQDGKSSLLDTEIVTDDNGEEKCKIFDAIVINGKRIAEQKFGYRRESIRNMVKKFDEIINDDYSLMCTMRIYTKKYFLPSAQAINDLFSMLKFDKCSNCWKYHDPARGVNKNDGIIFVPEDDDYFCRRLPLLKWKWDRCITIDFKIKEPYFRSNGELSLYCSGPATSSDLFIKSTRISEEDKKILNNKISILRNSNKESSSRESSIRESSSRELNYNELKDLKDDKGIIRITDLIKLKPDRNIDTNKRTKYECNDNGDMIIECKFNPSTGIWNIVNYRMDKKEANFITTVFATMENIIENITRDEIIKIVSVMPTFARA